MEAILVLAIWLGFLGIGGAAAEFWFWLKERHEKVVAQRIQARRMASKNPREKERVDYWAA